MSRTMNIPRSTPALLALKREGIYVTLHPYEHDPAAPSYGAEAATALGVAPAAVFKTLVVELDTGAFAVAVVPVSEQADLKAVATACAAKKAHLASEKDVTRLTGCVLGGVSPIATRTALTTVIDISARALERMYVSGGRRGLDVAIRPEELRRITHASYAPITRS